MTNGDKLLISINNKAFAVDATAVVAVVEVERIFMLPVIQSSSSFQKPGFIKGTITRRGEVVVVIDIGELFEMPSIQGKGPYRVAIIKKDALSLGILMPGIGHHPTGHLSQIGSVGNDKDGISFIWKEELDKLEFEPSTENYILGLIDPSGKKIRLLDWQKIFEKTQKLLGCRQ